MTPRQRSSGALVVLGFAVLGVLLWGLRGALDTEPVPASVAPAGSAAPLPLQVARPQALPLPLPVAPLAPEPREPPDLHGHDMIDPCTTGWEPTVPSGFETAMALGITVGWSPTDTATSSPYDVAPRPIAVAYLVNGLLEEAAALTGTVRRERLTVIVYASQAEYYARTGAPRWSGGLYDGGAVRMPVTLTSELGVAAGTLRHELMHAQLHAALGCMPAWFNEGVAMYFAGTPPLHEWTQMLRGHEPFEMSVLQGASLAEMTSDIARRAYAESLAMVRFVVEQSGEAGLRAAVQMLERLRRESPRGGLELWDRMVPGAGHTAVMDALAHKVFGASTGGELDAILRGPVCCTGLRAVSELRCRAGPPPPEGTGRETWIDRSAPRWMACRATW